MKTKPKQFDKILGYDWEYIKARQQGQIERSLPAIRTASVQCHRCEKFFRITSKDDYPIHCSECGFAHLVGDAKDHGWPFIN